MSAKEVTVRIVPVVGKAGAYVARYRAEMLGATYSVEFQDTVMGAIALHGFSEMLRTRYDLRRVELVVERPGAPFPVACRGGRASDGVRGVDAAGALRCGLSRRIARAPEGPREPGVLPGKPGGPILETAPGDRTLTGAQRRPRPRMREGGDGT
jgi:hypothetical protein